MDIQLKNTPRGAELKYDVKMQIKPMKLHNWNISYTL